MIKKGLLGLVLGIGLSFFSVNQVDAQSLKIEPLLINEAIQKGEKKKGFVDISNPTTQTLRLLTSVQAFRQKDNSGGLEFFDNEQVRAGLIPDLKEIELGPREAVRMYYLVDGTKLPQGDVFAALFVSTAPEQERSGVAQAVKLGTIFTLVNGTPGPRNAEITFLSSSFFQFGDSINGRYTIKNTADPQLSTGFYPEIKLRLAPFGTEQNIRSSLIMAGVERTTGFSFPDNRFGIYELSASYGSSVKKQYMVVMTGAWKLMIPAVLFLILLLVTLALRRRHHNRQYYRLSK